MFPQGGNETDLSNFTFQSSLQNTETRYFVLWRIKSLLRRLKNIGMVSEKLYRGISFALGIPFVVQNDMKPTVTMIFGPKWQRIDGLCSEIRPLNWPIIVRVLTETYDIVTKNNCFVHRLMFIALVFSFMKCASGNFQILEGVTNKWCSWRTTC